MCDIVRSVAPRTEPRDPLLAALGVRARQLRLARGLTLRELAEQSGLSLRFLLQIESGRGNVSVKRLAALADALGSSPAALLAAPERARPVIALLGLRGAGKTTVGRKLAKRLRLPFVELDKQIEDAAGLALGEIFSLHGEDYYRRLERETLAALLAEPAPIVLATGGGIVTSSDAMALLARHAVTVWLKADADDHWTRVMRQGDRRPMADQPQARDALRSLLASRTPLYARADITVDTSGATADIVSAEIERQLHSRAA